MIKTIKTDLYLPFLGLFAADPLLVFHRIYEPGSDTVNADRMKSSLVQKNRFTEAPSSLP